MKGRPYFVQRALDRLARYPEDAPPILLTTAFEKVVDYTFVLVGRVSMVAAMNFAGRKLHSELLLYTSGVLAAGLVISLLFNSGRGLDAMVKHEGRWPWPVVALLLLVPAALCVGALVGAYFLVGDLIAATAAK